MNFKKSFLQCFTLSLCYLKFTAQFEIQDTYQDILMINSRDTKIQKRLEHSLSLSKQYETRATYKMTSKLGKTVTCKLPINTSHFVDYPEPKRKLKAIDDEKYLNGNQLFEKISNLFNGTCLRRDSTITIISYELCMGKFFSEVFLLNEKEPKPDHPKFDSDFFKKNRILGYFPNYLNNRSIKFFRNFMDNDKVFNIDYNNPTEKISEKEKSDVVHNRVYKIYNIEDEENYKNNIIVYNKILIVRPTFIQQQLDWWIYDPSKNRNLIFEVFVSDKSKEIFKFIIEDITKDYVCILKKVYFKNKIMIFDKINIMVKWSTKIKKSTSKIDYRSDLLVLQGKSAKKITAINVKPKDTLLQKLKNKVNTKENNKEIFVYPKIEKIIGPNLIFLDQSINFLQEYILNFYWYDRNSKNSKQNRKKDLEKLIRIQNSVIFLHKKVPKFYYDNDKHFKIRQILKFTALKFDCIGIDATFELKKDDTKIKRIDLKKLLSLSKNKDYEGYHQNECVIAAGKEGINDYFREILNENSYLLKKQFVRSRNVELINKEHLLNIFPNYIKFYRQPVDLSFIKDHRVKKDKYFKFIEEIGEYGGYCQCPSGNIYAVGARKNDCKKGLACYGGQASHSCFSNFGQWSHSKVICSGYSYKSYYSYKPKGYFACSNKYNFDYKKNNLLYFQKNILRSNKAADLVIILTNKIMCEKENYCENNYSNYEKNKSFQIKIHFHKDNKIIVSDYNNPKKYVESISINLSTNFWIYIKKNSLIIGKNSQINSINDILLHYSSEKLENVKSFVFDRQNSHNNELKHLYIKQKITIDLQEDFDKLVTSKSYQNWINLNNGTHNPIYLKYGDKCADYEDTKNTPDKKDERDYKIEINLECEKDTNQDFSQFKQNGDKCILNLAIKSRYFCKKNYGQSLNIDKNDNIIYCFSDAPQ